MKATSIRTEGIAPWSATPGEHHINPGIAKVLFRPGNIGATTFLVIDTDGYLLKGTAAHYHDIEGIITILYQCKDLHEAAHEMRERHYRQITYIDPNLENAA